VLIVGFVYFIYDGTNLRKIDSNLEL